MITQMEVTGKEKGSQSSIRKESFRPAFTPGEVDIREDKVSIFEWMRKLKRGQLLLNPEFRRQLKWKDEQKSRFIESILLNIPLPPIYVYQDKSGRYIMVDGLERTAAIDAFMVRGEFRLQALQILESLNGKGFQELEPALKTKIEDKILSIYVVKSPVPIHMVYEIFSRINTGGDKRRIKKRFPSILQVPGAS